MMVVGALLLNRLVLLHADHPVGVVMMGNNGGYQHNNVDNEKHRYYKSFLPFHPLFYKNAFKFSETSNISLIVKLHYFFSDPILFSFSCSCKRSSNSVAET